MKILEVIVKALLKLEKLDSLLYEVNQSDWRSLNWALKPSMLALIQPKFLEHPCEGVRLIVASCLCEIIKLASLIPPYNDDIMRKVF